VTRLWVIYDERAMYGDTDIAQVLETCRTEREANRSAFPGVIFRYDVTEDGDYVNPFQVGMTKELARELKR